jgi:hypothetical protein
LLIFETVTEVYAWRVSKLMEHIPELLYREGEEGASSTSFERDAAECALIALLNCASHGTLSCHIYCGTAAALQTLRHQVRRK